LDALSQILDVPADLSFTALVGHPAPAPEMLDALRRDY
jgi:hypothetical protein